MKAINLVCISLFLAVLFSATVFAQTGTQTTSNKIVIINSNAFGDVKAGITKYVNAMKSLDTEFTPTQNELQTLNDKLNALTKEIQTLQDMAAGGKVPFDQNAAQAKVDEAERLQRDIKFKSEDAKARYERRQQVVLGPVMQEIGKALQEYAKQKGYLLIFDVAKDEAGFLLFGDDKADVTTEFITYFNVRAAAATTPK